MSGATPKSGAKMGKQKGRVSGAFLPPLWVRLLRAYHGIGAGAVVAVVLLANLDWAATAKQATPVLLTDESSPFHAMIHLHHSTPASSGDTALYRAGFDDLYFVGFAIAVLLFVRAQLRSFVFLPAARMMGVDAQEELGKFAEQCWQVMYYATAWCCGAYIMTHTPGWEWSDTRNLWLGYPHRDITSATKLYYLLQLSFWISQVVVTLIEKWRKDFVEMMLHHVITINLVFWSYFMNFTRVGVMVLVEQDFADVFLPLAKLFKYAKMETVSTATFAFFAVTWIVTRHMLFFIIYWSCCVEALEILNEDTHWDPENGGYFALKSHYTLIGFLTALQLLMLFWLKLLIQAVRRAITSDGKVDDVRSDSEAEGASGSTAKGKRRSTSGKSKSPTVEVVSKKTKQH